MKKLLLLLLFAGLLNTGSVFGWGREGHETIAKIAERNLTKKAKKRIEKYLGGHSIVYFAKWMDEYRHTPEYKFTNNWHTAPVNAELRYEDSMLAKNGNAIYGLEQAIENLKNYRSLTDSAVEVNLKYIIHLVGAGYLRSSVLSTRGPGWTYLWCTSCHANGTAGQLCTERINAESI